MKSAKTRTARLLLCLAILALLTGTASAQSHVRVTRDQSTIWARTFLSVETQVGAGTILEVVGRRDEWYEVVIPPEFGRSAITGFIAAPNVEPVDGQAAPRPDGRAPTPPRPVSRAAAATPVTTPAT